MDFTLDPVEVRVLGSLLEKEITTPEYYPLTLNALVNACNQKSNRDPAVSYDEDTVAEALESLRQKRLVVTVTGTGIRVPKNRQVSTERLNLGRREQALLTVLMLRGPQTLGELRSRSESMHSFTDLEEIEATLNRMMEWPSGPLVTRLARRAGTKEARFAHLLSGEPAGDEDQPPVTAATPRADRVAALESEVAQLREEVRSLRDSLSDLRRQFGLE